MVRIVVLDQGIDEVASGPVAEHRALQSVGMTNRVSPRILISRLCARGSSRFHNGMIEITVHFPEVLLACFVNNEPR